MKRIVNLKNFYQTKYTCPELTCIGNRVYQSEWPNFQQDKWKFSLFQRFQTDTILRNQWKIMVWKYFGMKQTIGSELVAKPVIPQKLQMMECKTVLVRKEMEDILGDYWKGMDGNKIDRKMLVLLTQRWLKHQWTEFVNLQTFLLARGDAYDLEIFEKELMEFSLFDEDQLMKLAQEPMVESDSMLFFNGNVPMETLCKFSELMDTSTVDKGSMNDLKDKGPNTSPINQTYTSPFQFSEKSDSILSYRLNFQSEKDIVRNQCLLELLSNLIKPDGLFTRIYKRKNGSFPIIDFSLSGVDRLRNSIRPIIASNDFNSYENALNLLLDAIRLKSTIREKEVRDVLTIGKDYRLFCSSDLVRLGLQEWWTKEQNDEYFNLVRQKKELRTEGTNILKNFSVVSMDCQKMLYDPSAKPEVRKIQKEFSSLPIIADIDKSQSKPFYITGFSKMNHKANDDSVEVMKSRNHMLFYNSIPNANMIDVTIVSPLNTQGLKKHERALIPIVCEALKFSSGRDYSVKKYQQEWNSIGWFNTRLRQLLMHVSSIDDILPADSLEISFSIPHAKLPKALDLLSALFEDNGYIEQKRNLSEISETLQHLSQIKETEVRSQITGRTLTLDFCHARLTPVGNAGQNRRGPYALEYVKNLYETSLELLKQSNAHEESKDEYNLLLEKFSKVTEAILRRDAMHIIISGDCENQKPVLNQFKNWLEMITTEKIDQEPLSDPAQRFQELIISEAKKKMSTEASSAPQHWHAARKEYDKNIQKRVYIPGLSDSDYTMTIGIHIAKVLDDEFADFLVLKEILDYLFKKSLPENMISTHCTLDGVLLIRIAQFNGEVETILAKLNQTLEIILNGEVDFLWNQEGFREHACIKSYAPSEHIIYHEEFTQESKMAFRKHLMEKTRNLVANSNHENIHQIIQSYLLGKLESAHLVCSGPTKPLNSIVEELGFKILREEKNESEDSQNIQMDTKQQNPTEFKRHEKKIQPSGFPVLQKDVPARESHGSLRNLSNRIQTYQRKKT